MNETLRLLYKRKSMRAFLPQPITPEIKEVILEAAFQAPTAGNQMLYTILNITDRNILTLLSELCDHQPFIATAPLVLIFLADCRRWLDTYKAAGLSPRKPGPGDLMLATVDATIAAQNAVVAADSMGVGSCYIGDITEHCEEIREMFSLPEEVMPAAMLVFGYPTVQQRVRKKPARIDREYVVFENTYRTLTPEEHKEMFVNREAREGTKNVDFIRQVDAFCKRKYNCAFSEEMSRSVNIYWQAFEAAVNAAQEG